MHNNIITLLATIIILPLTLIGGEPHNRHDMVIGDSRLTFDFDETDVIVHEDDISTLPVRITAKSIMFIHGDQVKLNRQQRKLVDRFYEIAFALHLNKEEMRLNDLPTGRAIAAIINRKIRSIDRSTGRLHRSELTELRAEIAELADEVDELSATLGANGSYGETMEQFRENAGAFRDLVGELTEVRQLMRERIPEIGALEWF